MPSFPVQSSHEVIMRVFSALLLSLSLLSGLQQQHKKTNQSRNSGTTDHLGTQDSPLFVKVLPAPKTQEETERENNDRNEKVANDRNLVNATYVLAGIGVLQLFVFWLSGTQTQTDCTICHGTIRGHGALHS